MRIIKRLNLAEARKDICIDGSPYEGLSNQISEWAWEYVTNTLPINVEITEEQLMQAIEDGIIQQNLDQLIEEGKIEAVWIDDKIKYRMAKIGR